MEEVEDRIVSTAKKVNDTEFEKTLRPQTLDEYVGQEKIKEKIKIYIESAKLRGEPIDHILFYGPPGLGKTTLSHIIANEMGSQIKITSGPAIERSADLCAILSNLNAGDVLFIDEIHRLNKNIEEILYPALEDFALDFVVGKGPSASSMRLALNPFTLIGATTRAGDISSPLRDRFGIIERLELYSNEELAQIIKRSASILKVEIDEDAVKLLASRSRGTPRIANRLIKRIRDFGVVFSKTSTIDKNLVDFALNKLEIDEIGLDRTDRQMLGAIITKFNGGPVGVGSVAASIGEEASTIEDVYEPYLIQLGFITRTPRGRVCLEPAYKHLNMPFDKKDN